MTGNYLFDWSVQRNCPSLLEGAILPSYIASDQLQMFSGRPIADSWPSLLVGPKGTRSALHVDGFATHFWMVMFKGKKRWRVYAREDESLLYPNPLSNKIGFDGHSPDFEKFPLSSLADYYDVELKSGEMILLPYDFPHQVTLLLYIDISIFVLILVNF